MDTGYRSPGYRGPHCRQRAVSTGTREPQLVTRGRGQGGQAGRGSHGGDGLVVEGDKGHAERLLVHLLLLPLVVFLQLLFQLCVVLDGLHLPGGKADSGQRAGRGPAAPASANLELPTGQAVL